MKTSARKLFKPLTLATKIKILSLAMEEYSVHGIAKELELAKNTVKKYLKSEEMEEIKEEVKLLSAPEILKAINKITSHKSS